MDVADPTGWSKLVSATLDRHETPSSPTSSG
jgi:hypothetical protein